MTPLRGQLALAAVLLVLACVAFLLSLAPVPVVVAPWTLANKPLAELIRAGNAPRPAFSTTTQERVRRSKGASALLSYAGEGFEPHEVTIKKGETMRFTNNSNHDMWIAAAASDGQRLYPGVSNGCGSSELDSCGVIHPQDFWEFTFEEKGTWRVANILDPKKSAIVRVE